MKVRYGLILALLSVGLTLNGSVRAQDEDMCWPGLSVRLPPSLSRVGETVNVRVTITALPENLIGFSDFSILLNYPEGIQPVTEGVRLVRAVEPLYQHTSLYVKDTPADRLLVVGSASNVGLGAEPGPVYDIPFKLSGGGAAPALPGSFLLTITRAQGGTPGEQCWKSEATDGSLLVIGPGGLGDVDGDGRTTISDAVWALQRITGNVALSPGVVKSADVWPAPEGDGEISIQDVIGILRMTLGLPAR